MGSADCAKSGELTKMTAQGRIGSRPERSNVTLACSPIAGLMEVILVAATAWLHCERQ